MDKEYDLPPAQIILHKLIPTGAGLGGGSSDASHTIQLLNKVFELGLDTKKLEEIASRLGSDCSFFIQNKPSRGTGKGDQLEPIALSLKGYYLVLVKPAFAISTSEAYEGIIPKVPEKDMQQIIRLPIDQWKDILSNDFEAVVCQRFPEIKNSKEMMYRQGALYASMSGSGSSVYGIFKEEVNVKNYFPTMFYWGGWL
jgi:4-diphosphocytidyl-2-C-methyl-D-erythritol kinase